jgi:hypothetical protein
MMIERGDNQGFKEESLVSQPRDHRSCPPSDQQTPLDHIPAIRLGDGNLGTRQGLGKASGAGRT